MFILIYCENWPYFALASLWYLLNRISINLNFKDTFYKTHQFNELLKNFHSQLCLFFSSFHSSIHQTEPLQYILQWFIHQSIRWLICPYFLWLTDYYSHAKKPLNLNRFYRVLMNILLWNYSLIRFVFFLLYNVWSHLYLVVLFHGICID